MSEIFPSIDDTDPIVRDLVIKRLRNMSAKEKLRQMSAFYISGLARLIDNVKQQHPNCSETQLKYHIAVRLHGEEFCKKFLSGKLSVEG